MWRKKSRRKYAKADILCLVQPGATHRPSGDRDFLECGKKKKRRFMSSLHYSPHVESLTAWPVRSSGCASNLREKKKTTRQITVSSCVHDFPSNHCELFGAKAENDFPGSQARAPSILLETPFLVSQPHIPLLLL